MSKFYFRMTIKLNTILGKSTIYQWRMVMLFMSKYYLGRSFGVQECILRKGSRFFSLPLESRMKSTNELCFCELSPYRYTLPKSRPGQACAKWGKTIFEILFEFLKFIYSEKATKFCEISTVDLTVTKQGKSMVEISQKKCGLLRIYEL